MTDTIHIPTASRQTPVEGALATRELAKHQPCGCVVCTCEDTVQCQGCGARHCGTHKVGAIPNPVYATPVEGALDVSAFTPGPWYVQDGYLGLVCAGDTLVAEAHDISGEPFSLTQTNAHLIAAAPDLYAALQTFVRKREIAPDGPLGVGLVNGDFYTAEAALAKARGDK